MDDACGWWVEGSEKNKPEEEKTDSTMLEQILGAFERNTCGLRLRTNENPYGALGNFEIYEMSRNIFCGDLT